jgi:hypothetical protein
LKALISKGGFIQWGKALLPVIAEQDPHGRVLRETARAIVDTSKWWP